MTAHAERHQPVLHPRDGYGRDEEWVEYREMPLSRAAALLVE